MHRQLEVLLIHYIAVQAAFDQMLAIQINSRINYITVYLHIIINALSKTCGIYCQYPIGQ